MQSNSTRVTSSEQTGGHVVRVAEHEVARIMRDEGAEVPANHAMRNTIGKLLVERMLNVSSALALELVLGQTMNGAINGKLRHMFRHVRTLNDRSHSSEEQHG